MVKPQSAYCIICQCNRWRTFSC